MFQLFSRFADWIIDHRWTSLFLIVTLTIVTALGHYDPYVLLPDPVPTSPLTVAPADKGEPQVLTEPPRNIDPVQVDVGDVIIVAESNAFFTPDGAEAMREVVSTLESMRQVYQVLWMDQMSWMNIFSLREPILPRKNATQIRFESAKERALEHPLIAGQLLSPDANTMLLMVAMDWMYVLEDADCTDALRDAATAVAAKYPNVDIRFRVTGNVPIRLSRAAANRANEVKYQIIGYSIALIVAFILFRGLSAVIIVALAPTLGVFWTLGIFHYIGWNDNPFNTVVVPVLLCMVGFTDGVHMMVQIRKHRASGMSPTDAARRSIREIGLACWLTSFTTAIGFGSLALAHHDIVREFGYCCVVGVLMTFLSVITVIPLACASPIGNRVHSGYGKNLVDQNLQRISGVIDFVLRHFRMSSWIAIATTMILASVTLMLRPDERLTSNLAASGEHAMALAHIDKAFGGMETARVDVSFPTKPADTGELATVTSEIEAALRAEPLIGHPLSIASLLEALPGDGTPSMRMPMLDLLPPSLKRSYYTPEYRRAKVTFRLQDIGIAKYGPVFERIESRLNVIRQEHPDFSISLNGSAIYRWRDLYQIVMDLAFSLGTASLIIFVVLAIVYRSLRIGVISIVPNTFPLAATGALLYFTGQYLEIVSVCAFTVCLGIAVDDTIHFLTRFYEEDRKTEDRQLAIRRSFVGVGTALIMTTAVLIIGFSTALLSDARDFRIFAAMGILTIGCALFADLVFLPALLLRYAPKRNKPIEEQT